ncbi:hypothetical protein Btru_076537 [Bulinus truncatus]|nr:hypothetical protein Btru_076537 [Bulinus truncatus]
MFRNIAAKMVLVKVCTLLMVLMINVTNTGAVTTKTCSSSLLPAHQYGTCGSTAITEKILSLCYSGNDYRLKRDSEEVLGTAALNKENALTFLTKRQITNIHCECCLNQCIRLTNELSRSSGHTVSRDDLPTRSETLQPRWSLSSLGPAHRSGICGDAITNTIIYLCNNQRSNDNRLKRDSEEVLGTAALNKENALTFLSKRQFVDIHCECCINHCSVNELLYYCP